MTETKTFKNTGLGTISLSPDTTNRWLVAGEQFSFDEWDMEVTFTKKAKPFRAGDAVISELDPNDPGTVLAVHGDYVWVQWGQCPNPSSWQSYELKHA
jgi:hypothetical protein